MIKTTLDVSLIDEEKKKEPRKETLYSLICKLAIVMSFKLEEMYMCVHICHTFTYSSSSSSRKKRSMHRTLQISPLHLPSSR